MNRNLHVVVDESLWTDIPGYDFYQAHPDGEIRNKNTERILQADTMKHYYRQVTIQPNDQARSVHKLVALTFCPNPLNFPQVNHKDGNKRNNESKNLEWVTASDNVRHAISMGREVSKNRSNPVRVTMKDGTIFDCESSADAAKKLDVSAGVISHCLRNDGLYCGVQGLLEKDKVDRWIFKVERAVVENEKVGGNNIEAKEVTVDGFKHLIAYTDGTLINKDTMKTVSGSLSSGGRYFNVKSTINADGKSVAMAKQQLIAMTFLENPENKKVVHHKDGCSTNNAVSNLQWMTQQESVQQAIKTGLISKETIKARSDSHKVPVYQLELDGSIVARFDSSSEADDSIGSSISAACHSYRKEIRGGSCRARITRGYRWCFVADYSDPQEEMKDNNNTNNNKPLTDIFPELLSGRNDISFEKIRPYVLRDSRPIWQIDLDGRRIKLWESIGDVKSVLPNTSNILSATKGTNGKSKSAAGGYGKNMAGGYFWQYATYDEMMNPEREYDQIIPELIKKALGIPEDCNRTIRSEITALLRENICEEKGDSLIIATRPFFQMNKDGEIVKMWSGPAVARKELGIGRNQIEQCLCGKTTTSSGFKWRWLTLDEMMM